jgi:hypothetical protein
LLNINVWVDIGNCAKPHHVLRWFLKFIIIVLRKINYPILIYNHGFKSWKIKVFIFKFVDLFKKVFSWNLTSHCNNSPYLCRSLAS